MTTEARKHKKTPTPDNGLEEQNWAEFPLAILADRAPDGLTKIEYSDSVEDSSTGLRVARSVGMWTHEDFGLPNWQDMDILLAAMTLTNEKNRFQERLVEFSIYELLDILRWPKHDGRYTNRIKLGLDRWNALFIKFTNSWRRNGKWTTTRAFHVLNNVDLTNTRDEFDAEIPQSFEWNRVIVESIQATNTKGLDWEFYCSLKRPTTKRLYRFLDKRFGLGSTWSWDMEQFATNKVGILPGQATFRYKERLKPAVAELEELGFIEPMPTNQRFEKVGKGLYRVNFKRARRQRNKKPAHEPTGLEKELLDRDARNAATLVASFPEKKIREQIANFDHRNAKGEKLGGAWLRKAIEEPNGYGFRKDYKSPEQIAAAQQKRDAMAAAEKKREKAERAKQAAEKRRIVDYIERLSPDEVSQLEEEGLAANTFIGRLLRKADPERAGEYRTMALHQHVAKLIKEAD